MVFNGADRIFIQAAYITRHAKAAIFNMAAGAPCNLRKLCIRKASAVLAIEFMGCGKGDMFDVHIQPHANRISRNQIINIAALI